MSDVEQWCGIGWTSSTVEDGDDGFEHAILLRCPPPLLGFGFLGKFFNI